MAQPCTSNNDVIMALCILALTFTQCSKIFLEIDVGFVSLSLFGWE